MTRVACNTIDFARGRRGTGPAVPGIVNVGVTAFDWHSQGVTKSLRILSEARLALAHSELAFNNGGASRGREHTRTSEPALALSCVTY